MRNRQICDRIRRAILPFVGIGRTIIVDSFALKWYNLPTGGIDHRDTKERKGLKYMIQLTKIKGMKTLTVSLIAGAALIVSVLVIAFQGTQKNHAPDKEDTLVLEATKPEDTLVHLGFDESTTTEEPKEETEPETTEAKKNALAFVSNGNGTCYLAGIGTYTSTEVTIPTLSPAGDIVTGIAPYAFYNCTDIIRVLIPSTVRTIGEYAFLGCTSLIEVSVAGGNTAFKTVDGILYTADDSRLILCPAMRGLTSCTLSAKISTIEKGAFADAKSVKKIFYGGSAAMWTNIFIGSHNDLLESVELTCNYEGK